MNYPINITHKLILETTRFYNSMNFNKCSKDFKEIKSVKKRETGEIVVTGTVCLYGYKIDGENPYCGFFDVVNQQLYDKISIENAKIIEYASTCIYESPVKPRKLKRKIKIC